MKKCSAIILAAGKGVRMKSSLPKALVELAGRPMVEFLIDSAKACGIKDIVVIGSHRIGLLKKRLAGRKVKVIEQKRLLGSADAVKQASGYFKNFKGDVVVLYADTPLIKTSTIKGLINRHRRSKAKATLLAAKTKALKEYGTIFRDKDGRICCIVEKTDINKVKDVAARNLPERNLGAYCFDSKKLFEGLKRIKKNKTKNEYYLTDIAGYFYNKNYPVISYSISDLEQAQGVNRREELSFAEAIINRRTIAKALSSGVTVKDPVNTYIQHGAKIGTDTIIYPFVVIEKNAVIGKNCRVGPFAHLRNGTVLKDNSSVGNFVEIVRSMVGKGSRAKHHSYLGDTIVGENVNVGAGTITANYDGRKKNKTIIGSGAFIGSGTTIVAPVRIGKKSITGAGSVVLKNRDVEPNTVVAGVPAKPLKKILRRGKK